MTLCDRKKYPRSGFCKVYGWRWRDETYYDPIKNIFEVERFSGLSEESIKQDFYGDIFLASLESILSWETERELEELAVERANQTLPRINHAGSDVALVGEVALAVRADIFSRRNLERIEILVSDKSDPDQKRTAIQAEKAHRRPAVTLSSLLETDYRLT